LRIILDMDQIICQFTEKVVEWWNTDHPDRPPKSIEDILGWDIDGYLGTPYFLRSCMRCPELWRDLSPVPGAIPGVKQLLNDGHDIRIASAVPHSAAVAYHGKLQWLRDHMPFFNLKHFYAISEKQELEGDLLFDDGLHNIEAWVKTGRPCVALDVPWNRKADHLPKDLVTRVYDWEEFLDEVKHRPFVRKRR
jgi:5'-nucleotidase